MLRTTCLALLLAFSLPCAAEDAKTVPSVLLVARKDLPDRNFRDSVVLVTQYAGASPIGLIINRPTSVALDRAFPEIEQLRGRPEKLFFGGPVKPEQVFVVFHASSRPAESVEVLDGIYMTANAQVIDDVLRREGPMTGVRVFAGYAGWAPGQLEAEVARGDWHLMHADAKAIFERKPETLWPELDRRASAVRASLPYRGLRQRSTPTTFKAMKSASMMMSSGTLER